MEEATTVQTAKKGVKDFLASIENKKSVNVKVEPQKSEKKNEERSVPPPSNPLLAVISFLECLRCDSKDGRILISKSVDKLQSKLQFLLLNPSSNFSDVVKEARSVNHKIIILTSSVYMLLILGNCCWGNHETK